MRGRLKCVSKNKCERTTGIASSLLAECDSTDTMISRVLAKVNHPASSFLRPAGKGTIDDRHLWHSKLGRPNSTFFWNMSDTNRSADEQTRPPLARFHFLRQLAKLLGLLVARLYLHLCKLSRFFTRQKQNQRFKLSCRVVSVVGLCLHQAFKFPQCLVVIHISSFPRVHPLVWVGVITLEQRRPLAIVNIKR
jgi:hypothetical protein